jgi:hypothetical protein
VFGIWIVERYVRASTARANCIYIALLYYERYHLRVSCSRYVNAAREQRGRDIPSCSHLHRIARIVWK